MQISTTEHAALVRQVSMLDRERAAHQATRQQNIRLLSEKQELATIALAALRVAKMYHDNAAFAWERLKDYAARIDFTDKLRRHQELTPEKKIYLMGTAGMAGQGWRAQNRGGGLWMTVAQIQAETGLKKDAQRRVEQKLSQDGSASIEVVFDAAQATSRKYVKLAEGALLAPDTLTVSPDAPKHGGARTPRTCQNCGSDALMVDERIITTYTCKVCQHQEEEEGKPRLISFPDLHHAQKADAWGQVLEEARGSQIMEDIADLMEQPLHDSTPDFYGTDAPSAELFDTLPLLALPSKENAHPMFRVATVPCRECGGFEQRNKLGTWVCVGCDQNPFALRRA